MSDFISRQAAIEALDFKTVHMMGVSNDEKNITNPFAQYNKGLEDGIKAIRGLPSAEPEGKTKIEMNWATYFDNMGTAVIHIPYSYKCGNCGCQLQRTYDGIDINYCPKCGYKLEWK